MGNPLLNHPTYRIFVLIQFHRLAYIAAGSERKRTIDIGLVLGCREDDDRRLLQRMCGQDRVSRHFRNVQVKNYEIWFEIGFAQHLERLFTVSGDVEMNRYRTFGKGLPDEEGVPGVIFHEKNFGRIHCSFTLHYCEASWGKP